MSQPRPQRQRRATKRAAWSLSAVSIGQFPQPDRSGRYAAVELASATSLMRHFLSLAVPPAPLAGCMSMRAAAASLVSRPCTMQRFAPADTRTLPGAVDLPVIATPADAHLHAAALAVVEPVGRLEQRSQPLSPQHWTAPGRRGIKSLPIRLLTGAAHRGPGGRRQSRPGPSSIDRLPWQHSGKKSVPTPASAGCGQPTCQSKTKHFCRLPAADCAMVGSSNGKREAERLRGGHRHHRRIRHRSQKSADLSSHQHLVVAHTEEGDIIRIISARATRSERTV